MRENLRFENLVAHERVVVGSDPFLIVALHHFGERAVGLLLLHTQHVGHAGFGVGEREFPSHQRVVELIPVIDGACHGYLLADAHKLLLIVACGFLRHQRLAVQVFLDGKQNLHRVHRLNQIVGNLAADSLIHDVFLLAFRNHNHGHIGLRNLDLLQRLQSADARHILIENDEVEILLRYGVECVATVGHCGHFVAFVLQKQNMRFQEIDFVVGPENLFLVHISVFIFLLGYR